MLCNTGKYGFSRLKLFSSNTPLAESYLGFFCTCEGEKEGQKQCTEFILLTWAAFVRVILNSFSSKTVCNIDVSSFICVVLQYQQLYYYRCAIMKYRIKGFLIVNWNRSTTPKRIQFHIRANARGNGFCLLYSHKYTEFLFASTFGCYRLAPHKLRHLCIRNGYNSKWKILWFST